MANWQLIDRYCGSSNPVEVFVGKSQDEIRAAVVGFNSDYLAANNEAAFTADEIDELVADICYLTK